MRAKPGTGESQLINQDGNCYWREATGTTMHKMKTETGETTMPFGTYRGDGVQDSVTKAQPLVWLGG